ncbi:hypothetical protein CRYUN_Cryun09bG0027000 [Craigia yunnanensis]
MATTRINLSPQSLAAFIIFSLLFIVVSANKNVNANAKPTQSPPTTSTTKTNVVPGKRKNAKFVSDFVSAYNMVRLPNGHAPMQWNYTLAYFAKQWAKKRVSDCKLTHSYGPYGENLFWDLRSHWKPSAVVKSWVEEKAFYDPKSNSCGHYTQVVWKDAVRIGCARVRCNNNKGLYVICNYDPPDNFLNKHPFGKLGDAENLLKNSHPPPPKPSVVAPKPPILPVPTSKKSLSVTPKPMQISG